MKLELQVTQPQTGKILKAFGVQLKAENYWRYLPGKRLWELIPRSKTQMFDKKNETVPAFTLFDLGNMIPWGFLQNVIVHKMPGGIWQTELSDKKMHSFPSETEARAFYLIDLLKSEQVKVDEINHPEKYNVVMPSGKTYPKKKIASSGQ